MADDQYRVVGPMRRIIVERQDDKSEEDESIVEVDGEVEVEEDDNGEGDEEKEQESEGLPRIHIDKEAGNWMAELRAEGIKGDMSEPASGILALPDSYVGQSDRKSYVRDLVGEQEKEEGAIMKSLKALLDNIGKLVGRSSDGN